MKILLEITHIDQGTSKLGFSQLNYARRKAKRSSYFVVLGLLWLIISFPATAIEQLPDSCEFDPHVLTCFWPYDTELREFHHDQLDAIAIEVKNSFAAKRPLNEILLKGYAVKFQATDPPVYKNSLLRAHSAFAVLRERLTSHGVPLSELNIIPIPMDEDEPSRFKTSTGEGRAYNRRVEIVLTHVPPPAKDKPKSKGKKNRSLVFSKNTVKEPNTHLMVPTDMPSVRFPKSFKGCSDKRKRIEKVWLFAHYFMWRADQVMDWLAAQPLKKRKAAWHKGEPKEKGDMGNSSPRNWFGPYKQKRFDNVDAAIDKVFTKRFLGRTFKISCKAQPKKDPYMNARHDVFGHIVLYDHFFTFGVFEQARILVHEIYHGLVLHNGTWVRDTHTICGKGCKTKKHYGEAAAQELSWGGKERHYRLAIRNNDNHAFFAKNLGVAIYSSRGTLPQFPW